MQIEYELKLDYDDVLIRPKRSTLDTRKKANLSREYYTLNSNQTWSGVPIVVANMDSVGTEAMLKTMVEFDAVVALHKFYTFDQLVKIANAYPKNRFFYTLGSSNEEINNLKRFVDYLTNEHPEKESNIMINLDVANGYTAGFHYKVEKIRNLFPDLILMAGNIATPEMTQQLLECGADVVKIGVGPGSVCVTRIKTGCFVAGTKVNTNMGLINIEDIKIGDLVLTHDGTYQKVIQSHELIEDEELIQINGITCTKNHEFYVIHKRNQNKVNEDNIHELAEWIKAEDLTDDYFLLEIEE